MRLKLNRKHKRRNDNMNGVSFEKKKKNELKK